MSKPMPMRRERGTTRLRGEQAGYSLVELMVSMAIMLGVTGTIFTLVNPSQGAFRVQPEVADMQQRMRVAVDMMYKDLIMAGAGTYQGANNGALVNLFAPIVPYRTGLIDPDPASGVFYRPDAISLMYVPSTIAQTTISQAMPNVSAEIKVSAVPGCPLNDELCGLKEGMTIMIFDDTGAMDTFQITNVQTNALHLQHRNQQLSKAYGAGSSITQVETHTYYLDTVNDQLRHYDGANSDLPLVDDVVGLTFRYFGDPNPPLLPKPTIGVENCLFDTSGNPKLTTLPAVSSLVELTQAMLIDGPFCGVVGGNQFDADLYRVRKVRVDLRMQVAALDLRGSDPILFARQGQSSSGARQVPDYEMSFEVSPRNMNLMR